MELDKSPYSTESGTANNVVNIDEAKSKQQQIMKINARVSFSILNRVYNSFDTALIKKKSEKNLTQETKVTHITQ